MTRTIQHQGLTLTVRNAEPRRSAPGGWLKGTVRVPFQGGQVLDFQALIFELPSEEYGINAGRISKLWIATPRPTRRVVFEYDRDLNDDGSRRDVTDQLALAVVAALESAF